MNVDIETLATYPTESDDWILTVLIGGAALIFSFLIVPWFLVSGYLVRALRAGMAGAEEPPVFDNWGELLKEGLVAGIITFIYQLVPLIVLVFFVGGSLIAMITGGDAGAGLGFLGLFGGFFLAWVLSVVFGFIGFAGVANYAKEGSFGAGFDFGVITDVITSGSYLMAWVYVIALQIVVGILVSVVGTIIPFIGGAIAMIPAFYALIIAAWLLGNGFAEAIDMPLETDTSTEGDSAAI